MTTSYTYYKVQ